MTFVASWVEDSAKNAIYKYYTRYIVVINLSFLPWSQYESFLVQTFYTSTIPDHVWFQKRFIIFWTFCELLIFLAHIGCARTREHQVPVRVCVIVVTRLAAKSADLLPFRKGKDEGHYKMPSPPPGTPDLSFNALTRRSSDANSLVNLSIGLCAAKTSSLKLIFLSGTLSTMGSGADTRCCC